MILAVEIVIILFPTAKIVLIRHIAVIATRDMF